MRAHGDVRTETKGASEPPAGDAAYVTAADGLIVEATPALLALTGVPRALGWRPHDLLHGPATQHPGPCPLEARAAGVVDETVLASDGARVPVSVTRVPLAGGGLVGILRVGPQDPEAAFRAFLDSTPDAMVITDDRGRIVHLNEQAERLFGYPLGELAGERVERLIPARHRDAHVRDRDAYLRDPRVRPMGRELPLTGARRDGTEFPVEISLSPVTVGGRRLVAAAVRDVSDRLGAERRFRALLESAPDAIVISDAKGVITLVNSQAEAIFGYPRAELVGLPIEVLLPQRYRERHEKHRREYASAPRVRPMGVGLTLFGRRKDGTEFPVEISLAPLETPEGPVFMSAIRDASLRRRMESELKQKAHELERSNAELEQFAYVTSHDLQEPLRMVASYVQLLERRYKGKLDPEADEFIHYAADGAMRMQRLIADLLAFSRVGTHVGDLVPVESGAALARAIDNLKAAIDESGAVVTSAGLPRIRADPTLLTQLLQNLVGNAIKFRGERPPVIAVTATEEDAAWHFVVRDNGIGIAPEYHERVFVIFQRLHARERYPGTGIGLAICRKIVERHGGRIWVESREGEGAAFHFTIPKPAEGAP